MNRYLLKIASEDNPLRKHQERALKKLEQTGGLILDHSTGSGKTRTFLEAVARAQKGNQERSLVIAPASLVSNIDKEIKKHNLNIDRSRLDAYSYEKATNIAEKLKNNKYGIAVFDEAHKLRNTNTKRHQELSEVVRHAKQRVLATATTAYNNPSDIAPLVNIAAGDKVLPEDKKSFDGRFIDKVVEQPPLLKRLLGSPPQEKHVLKNKKELKEKLNKYVDHYDLADDSTAKDNFPEKIEKTVEVPMSGQQQAIYKYLEGKLPWHLRLKVRMNMPLDKKDSAALNSFSTGIRQASNSVRPYLPKYEEVTPKVKAAVDSLEKSHKEDKNFRGLVYSNYIQAGLEDYSRELTKRGISHNAFHGKMSKTQKDQAVKDYNEGKSPVLLISSSGAEGLDLKGTKKIQVLEPHFNHSKIKQVMGRGVRYGSHEHLPKVERKVEIEHYLSTFPEKKFSFGPKQHSIDQYLKHNSKTKETINDEMKKLVKDQK